MHRVDDPTQVTRVRVGEQLAIALAGNPTTGYTWQVEAESDCLELLGQEFERGGQGVGAGGQEVFTFRAVGKGEAEIACTYRRPWDAAARDSRRFRVVIE
jgi:inhibitor of cysteine peptidase